MPYLLTLLCVITCTVQNPLNKRFQEKHKGGIYLYPSMVSLFAARSIGVKDIVLLGNLTSVRYAREIFPTLSQIFGVNFIIPENSQFGTVIGTALCG